eukprot:13460185-Alexandrium_andersonii.AAC.1
MDSVQAALWMWLLRSGGGARLPGGHELYSDKQKKDVGELMDGTLLRQASEAIRAYGHGTFRRSDGRVMPIGGSTGGISRHVLDGREEPDVE